MAVNAAKWGFVQPSKLRVRGSNPLGQAIIINYLRHFQLPQFCPIGFM